MKYVYRDSPDQAKHWSHCEQEHRPYIEIRPHGDLYSEIFYDITNIKGDLERVSDSLRDIYGKYVEFSLIPLSDVTNFIDAHYLFTLLVRKTHTELFADALYDYLVFKLQSR